jgi:LysR family glycine cleavage system transcriptional activator
MNLPRRYLPPISLLCAFEAASRHESFSTAARELNLTQSAVSRQIRALEDILGAELFHRERQTVTLTVAGSAYAREIREALGRIASATLGYRANPANRSLRLAVLPTFGTRWLASRLPRFTAQNPGFLINLSTRNAPFDFAADHVDAAIHFGQAQWPGADMMYLMGEQSVPVCSPGFVEQRGIHTAEDLAAAPLLHLETRPDAWERWFALKGVEANALHGMLFDQIGLMAEAAIAGLGVALVPQFLFRDELEHGALVEAVPDGLIAGSEGYYLVWPPSHEHQPALERFRAWLAGEVAEMADTPREAVPAGR